VLRNHENTTEEVRGVKFTPCHLVVDNGPSPGSCRNRKCTALQAHALPEILVVH
jgi:hypothetical protein